MKLISNLKNSKLYRIKSEISKFVEKLKVTCYYILKNNWKILVWGVVVVRARITSSVLVIIVFFLWVQPVFAEDTDEVDFSKIFENHGLVRLIIDSKTGKIEYGNKAAVQFYGYSKEQLLNMTIQDINTLNEEQVKKEMEAAYKEERNYFIFQHRLANGEVRHVEVHSYPVVQEGKETLYSVIIDITPRVLLEQSLEKSRNLSRNLLFGMLALAISLITVLLISRERYKKLANHDSLTGAYSRVYLNYLIEHEMGKLKNNQSILLVEIDIDRFKSINDNYGHVVGDEVLKKVVEVLKTCTRRGDFVIRYGGDEFIMLLHNCNKKLGISIIKRIQDKLIHNKEFDFPIQFSYGIEELYHDKDFRDILRKADAKMYNHKCHEEVPN